MVNSWALARQRIVLKLEVTPITEQRRYARDNGGTTVAVEQQRIDGLFASVLCLIILTVFLPQSIIRPAKGFIDLAHLSRKSSPRIASYWKPSMTLKEIGYFVDTKVTLVLKVPQIKLIAPLKATATSPVFSSSSRLPKLSTKNRDCILDVADPQSNRQGTGTRPICVSTKYSRV